jgi:hypothetical protein
MAATAMPIAENPMHTDDREPYLLHVIAGKSLE